MLKVVRPTYKSRYLEWTDAGPSVGIYNYDVKFRIAQRIRIINLDYFIRLHLSDGDSSQNEVEKCQGYIGDAVCDGGPLEWEHKILFDETSLDDFKKLSLKEIEHLELKRIEFNAFKVCDEVVTRINGAPGPDLGDT